METNRAHCWVSYEISLFLSFRDNDMKNQDRTRREYIQMCFE